MVPIHHNGRVTTKTRAPATAKSEMSQILLDAHHFASGYRTRQDQVEEYEFINGYAAAAPKVPPVLKMSHWLWVSDSGFYHWSSRLISVTTALRTTFSACARYSSRNPREIPGTSSSMPIVRSRKPNAPRYSWAKTCGAKT